MTVKIEIVFLVISTSEGRRDLCDLLPKEISQSFLLRNDRKDRNRVLWSFLESR
jgi:hypothetical protein